MSYTSITITAGASLFAGTAALAQVHHDATPQTAIGSPVVSMCQAPPVTAPPEHSPQPEQTTVSHHNIRLGLTADRQAVLAGDGTLRVRVDIDSLHQQAIAPRIPTDVVVVLDRSGSMNGSKLAHAKQALHELVRELQAEDRLSLITFASDRWTLLQNHPATARVRANIHQTIDGIQAGGGTNLGAGLQQGLALAETSRHAGRAARVIVLSDGESNEGMSHQRIIHEARRAPRQEFVVTAVGLGMEFNEFLMQRLADAGTGNYHYIRNSSDLGEVFVHEFTSARTQVASGLHLRVPLPQGVQLVGAAGYPIHHSDGAAGIDLGALGAGQQRSFWLTYRLATDDRAQVTLPLPELSATIADHRQHWQIGGSLSVAVERDVARAMESIDKEAWADGVVQEEYNRLKDEVARRVRAGDQVGARTAVHAYRTRIAAQNAAVQSPTVSANLEAVDELDAEVQESFTGADQSVKQNAFSKQLHADGLFQRRNAPQEDQDDRED